MSAIAQVLAAMGCASNKATGGTITYIGGYTIHKLSNGETFTVVSSRTGTTLAVDYLIVASGGGGGNGTSGYNGGGGDAGQMLSGSTEWAIGAYPVAIGAVGMGSSSSAPGATGGNASINGITAIGGYGGDSTTTHYNGALVDYNGDGAGSAGTYKAGGDGLASSITGVSKIYAAGGKCNKGTVPLSDYVAGDGGGGGSQSLNNGGAGTRGTVIVRYLT